MRNTPDHSESQPCSNDRDWLNPAWIRRFVDGRTLLIGITGGIAAYKSCTIVSRLAQAGANVHVAMTPSAAGFVTPMTFEALSGHRVHTSAMEQIEPDVPDHIAIADRCDAAMVVPCTMNTLAKLVHGLGDDAVSLMISAIDRQRVPVLLVPAMNDGMWNQPSTQRNIKQAQADGFKQVGPGVGWQACRHEGTGRMSEPEHCIEALCRSICPDLDAD